MNEWKPTIGIEFDDKYMEAKNKLIDLMKALNDLTPTQREQLAREFAHSMGMTVAFEQFVRYMNACKQKVKQKLSEICRCREGEKQQHKKAAASASA